MNIFENELQQLKPYDEVQYYKTEKNGYGFIGTAGHGYLVVPNGDMNQPIAWDIYKKSGYGFEGHKALYLEEDYEAPAFLKAINAI